jgi:hypothetical protein
LWIDGFRRPDGTVRQYIFTAEELRGIAHQIIGEEKVYAIGIAFYISKKVKSENEVKKNIESMNNFTDLTNIDFNKDYGNTFYTSCMGWGSDEIDSVGEGNFECLDKSYFSGNEPRAGSYESLEDTFRGAKITCQASIGNVVRSGEIPISKSMILNTVKHKTKTIEESLKLEIGAGALIKQKIYSDIKDLDYWNDEPSGILHINYCSMAMYQEIINKGRKKEKEEGFMDLMKIGTKE